MNLLRFAEDARTISLGGKNTISVQPGDRLLIHSPGGGGYGAVSTAAATSASEQQQQEEDAAGAANSSSTDGGVSVPTRISGSLNQYSLNQESV